MIRIILILIPVLLVVSVVVLSREYKKWKGSGETRVSARQVEKEAEKDEFVSVSRFVEIRGFVIHESGGFVSTDEGHFHFGHPARLGGRECFLLRVEPDSHLLIVQTDRVEAWPFIVIPAEFVPWVNPEVETMSTPGLQPDLARVGK